MPTLGVRSVRNSLPIISHGLADMQAMLCTLGLVHGRLANLLSVLIGEFPVLSLEFFHCAPGASMPASVINIQSPAKRESVVGNQEVDPGG